MLASPERERKQKKEKGKKEIRSSKRKRKINCTNPESNRGLVEIKRMATTKFTTNPLVLVIWSQNPSYRKAATGGAVRQGSLGHVMSPSRRDVGRLSQTHSAAGLPAARSTAHRLRSSSTCRTWSENAGHGKLQEARSTGSRLQGTGVRGLRPWRSLHVACVVRPGWRRQTSDGMPSNMKPVVVVVFSNSKSDHAPFKGVFGIEDPNS